MVRTLRYRAHTVLTGSVQELLSRRMKARQSSTKGTVVPVQTEEEEAAARDAAKKQRAKDAIAARMKKAEEAAAAKKEKAGKAAQQQKRSTASKQANEAAADKDGPRTEGKVVLPEVMPLRQQLAICRAMCHNLRTGT